MTLMDSIASASIATIKEVEGRHLAITSWSFAALDLGNCPLRDAPAASSLRKITQSEPQSLSNTAWSMAWLMWGPRPRRIATVPVAPPLGQYQHLALPPKWHTNSLIPQDLAVPAWPDSTMAVPARPLLHAISSSSLRTLSHFPEHVIASTAWSVYVRGGLRPEAPRPEYR